MTQYKKLLKVLLALVFEHKKPNYKMMEQIVIRHGVKYGYVELNENDEFVLTEKGKKIVADYLEK